MISDARILVTGVSGTIGSRLATHLAADNEVWGVARFGDPETRRGLEAAGITTRSVDLASGEFGDLPDDFTHVLHLAWMRAGLEELQDALAANVEGAGLLLAHCRKAEAALVMSGMGIYSPHSDPWHLYSETDPIGRAATAYAPTSPASKAGLEAVARFCARAFELPIVVTRLNTFMGPPESFPGMHIAAVLSGGAMAAPCDPNPHSPIHIDDMCDQLEALLDAASVPATIVNWCGDELVTSQEWTARASELTGRPGSMEVLDIPGAPPGAAADAMLRRSITGPCRVEFAGAFDRLCEEMVGGG